MINYSISLRANPSDQDAPKKAYANAQYSEIMTLDKFAEHISTHGSKYNRADIQAVAEGKAIGKAIGKAEGKAEGEAEGRLKERLEIARKLKENGFSIADIVRVAGLSAEEIDKL
jgi:predicted transposase/invertase (TIGR01784 family)